MHSTGPLTNQSLYSFLLKGETTKRQHCGWNNKVNKNCNDFMRNRNRDLSVSSAGLEPNAPPRAPRCKNTPPNSRGYLCLVRLCNYKCLNTGILNNSAVFIHTCHNSNVLCMPTVDYCNIPQNKHVFPLPHVTYTDSFFIGVITTDKLTCLEQTSVYCESAQFNVISCD
jgi:hypothetical protein